jgi:hypothetical protein
LEKKGQMGRKEGSFDPFFEFFVFFDENLDWGFWQKLKKRGKKGVFRQFSPHKPEMATPLVPTRPAVLLKDFQRGVKKGSIFTYFSAQNKTGFLKNGGSDLFPLF